MRTYVKQHRLCICSNDLHTHTLTLTCTTYTYIYNIVLCTWHTQLLLLTPSAYPLEASSEEVVVDGAEVTTVIPWKVGWSTNEAFAGIDVLVLDSCWSWASSNLCCWSVAVGSRSPVSCVTCADTSPELASRLEGLALLETADCVWAGMTWTWMPLVADGCWVAIWADEALASVMFFFFFREDNVLGLTVGVVNSQIKWYTGSFSFFFWGVVERLFKMYVAH